MAAGGKAINLGELAIAIALKTGALEAGLKDVQKKLKDHGKNVQKTGADYDKLAIVAGVAFWKITAAIGSGVKAFNDFNSSMVGLKSIVQGTGSSFQEAQGFIDDFISDGLIPASDAATALKNLLSRGFGLDEATTILNRFKDAAAFGRQGSLSLGEAVRSATEGIKNENSVLVDNAGVTKNVSVMWKEYAATIGKSANELTIAEKRQAEYNGILKETRFQIGDAAKYANEFAGAQAKAAAEGLKLQQAFGGALTPALGAFLNVLTPVISGLTAFVKGNPELVAALTLTVTAFVGIITVVSSVRAAIALLGPAIAALKVSLAGLMLNPVVLALTALAAVVGIVVTQVAKAKKEQDEYNASLERFNKIKKEGITKVEVPQLQEEVDTLGELIAEYEKVTAEIKKFEEEQEKINNGTLEWNESMGIRAHKAVELQDALEKVNKALKEQNVSYEDAKERVKAYVKVIADAQRVTLQEHSDQAKTIAQKRQQIMETENLIKAYRNAEKSSSEWKKAQKELADQFPQFSTASGIIIDAIEDVVAAQNDQVKQEWNNLQDKIRLSIAEVELEIQKKNAILATNKARLAAADAVSGQVTTSTRVMQKWGEEISQQEAGIKKQRDGIEAMQALMNTPIEKMAGVKPVKDDYGAYENAALDSALKILNHKKRMNQLSLEDELKALESISKKYINTADERMELDERIYEVRQAIIARDKQSEEEAIEASNEAMQKRTQSSLDWIESKKHIGDISAQDEIAAYDRMIAYHKEYLSKLLAGKKELSEQEQAIREEEEQQIKEFERKKYDIQKSYQEQLRRTAVDDINDLSAGVESALRKRYEKERDLREQALSDAKKDLDEWKDAELDRIDEVYDARIDAINATAKAQKKSIQDEIDSLDQSVKEKDRGEVDAAELQKISAIKERIQYEHDERNKLSLQKELDKLQEERENRLYKQGVEDHKDALRDKLADIQENADRQKEILKQRQEDEIARIHTLYDNEKRSIENRQVAWKAYYAERLSNASLQAEAEKLIIANNQTEIITLLKGYGEDYKLAGQTLGEKLYEGFKPQVDAIRTLIGNITAEINSIRDKAINAAVDASNKPASVSSDSAAGKNVTLNQTNNFNMPVDSPSAVSRKIQKTSTQLAQELG